MSWNEWSFEGEIEKEPESYAAPSTGKRVITLHCVLIDEARQGIPEKLIHVKIKVFEKYADLAIKAKKGDTVIAKGKLSENNWKDKNSGQDKSYIEFISFYLKVIPGGQETKKSSIVESHPFLAQTASTSMEDLPF